jgi:hypothetical protein
MSTLGDYDNREISGMIGRGNRSTRRTPAPMPLCPPQNPHAARTRTRAAAVGSQRLTAELRHGLSCRLNIIEQAYINRFPLSETKHYTDIGKGFVTESRKRRGYRFDLPVLPYAKNKIR